MPSDQDIIQLVEENQSKGDIVKFCGQCTNHHDALQVVNAAWDLKNKELNYSIMGLAAEVTGPDYMPLYSIRTWYSPPCKTNSVSQIKD